MTKVIKTCNVEALRNALTWLWVHFEVYLNFAKERLRMRYRSDLIKVSSKEGTDCSWRVLRSVSAVSQRVGQDRMRRAWPAVCWERTMTLTFRGRSRRRMGPLDSTPWLTTSRPGWIRRLLLASGRRRTDDDDDARRPTTEGTKVDLHPVQQPSPLLLLKCT